MLVRIPALHQGKGSDGRRKTQHDLMERRQTTKGEMAHGLSGVKDGSGRDGR